MGFFGMLSSFDDICMSFGYYSIADLKRTAMYRRLVSVMS